MEDQNILQWGDISTLSFHATKVFHMVEGGGVVARDRHLNQQFDLLRAFGHVHRDYLQLGTNAKNSEFHSAIGLLNLKQLPTNYEARKAISESYQAQLGGIASISTLNPKKYPGLSYNYAYYPIFCTDNGLREALVDGLNAEEIYPRRYLRALSSIRYPSCPMNCAYPARSPSMPHVRSSVSHSTPSPIVTRRRSHLRPHHLNCRLMEVTAVMQPYLFPYLPYYQLVDAVDTFIFYDDVQFIKRGYVNRNQLPYGSFSVPLDAAPQEVYHQGSALLPQSHTTTF